MKDQAMIGKGASPQDSICSAFITWVCDECDASAGNTYCSTEDTLEKTYTYGLLQRRSCSEDKACESRAQ